MEVIERAKLDPATVNAANRHLSHPLSIRAVLKMAMLSDVQGGETELGDGTRGLQALREPVELRPDCGVGDDVVDGCPEPVRQLNHRKLCSKEGAVEVLRSFALLNRRDAKILFRVL